MKWLLCFLAGGHQLKFIRNVYGDEINACGARSIWKCYACGTVKYKPTLHCDKE